MRQSFEEPDFGPNPARNAHNDWWCQMGIQSCLYEKVHAICCGVTDEHSDVCTGHVDTGDVLFHRIIDC